MPCSERVESAVRAAHDDLVARFERKDIGRGDTGIDIHETAAVSLEGRCGNAHGEHEHVAFGGIVGHGVGANRGYGVDTLQGEKPELQPCR